MENVAEGNSRALHLYETHPMTCHLVLWVPCRCQMAHSNCRPLRSIDTKWRAMVWEDMHSLPFHAKRASACWLQDHLQKH